MCETRKSKILADLKRLAFAAPGGISRRDAAGRFGIDLRTAGAYLESLCDAGLLRREARESASRGRPGSVYRSNTGKLAFLGISIRQNLEVITHLMDAAGKRLAGERFTLPPSPSHLTLFGSVLQAAKKYTSHHDRCLGGIGVAISRWLQPPLSGSELCGAFEEYLERALGVPVHRDVNINALAYACSVASGKRNLGIIHAGNVIEFGLVKNGEPVRDFAKREAWLSHLCVNPKGRQCYCGKFGCFVNYVSAAALRERLAVNNSPLNERALGELLGIALVSVASHYPELEELLFFGALPLQRPAMDYFYKHAPHPEILKITEMSFAETVTAGIALEAAHFELYQYLPDNPELHRFTP